MNAYLWIVGVVVSIPILIFLFFGYLRAKRPHSKKKAEEQEKLDKKQGKSSGTTTIPPEPNKEGNKVVRTALIVFGVIVALFLAWWFLPSLQSPSLGTVWGWAVASWLWILIVLPAIALIVSQFIDDNKKWSKALKTVAVMLPVIFVGLWLGNMIWGEKSPSQQAQQVVPQDCTSAGPCTLVVRTDGPTERAHIPQGKSVCFEPFFWSNIQRLGYKTSYKGGDVGGTGVPADTFWFVPEGGIKVPKHWFVQEGATQC